MLAQDAFLFRGCETESENRERGTGNGERGMGNGERGTWNGKTISEDKTENWKGSY